MQQLKGSNRDLKKAIHTQARAIDQEVTQLREQQEKLTSLLQSAEEVTRLLSCRAARHVCRLSSGPLACAGQRDG